MTSFDANFMHKVKVDNKTISGLMDVLSFEQSYGVGQRIRAKRYGFITDKKNKSKFKENEFVLFEELKLKVESIVDDHMGMVKIMFFETSEYE